MKKGGITEWKRSGEGQNLKQPSLSIVNSRGEEVQSIDAFKSEPILNSESEKIINQKYGSSEINHNYSTEVNKQEAFANFSVAIAESTKADWLERIGAKAKVLKGEGGKITFVCRFCNVGTFSDGYEIEKHLISHGVDLQLQDSDHFSAQQSVEMKPLPSVMVTPIHQKENGTIEKANAVGASEIETCTKTGLDLESERQVVQLEEGNDQVCSREYSRMRPFEVGEGRR